MGEKYDHSTQASMRFLWGIIPDSPLLLEALSIMLGRKAEFSHQQALGGNGMNKLPAPRTKDSRFIVRCPHCRRSHRIIIRGWVR